MIDWTLRSFLPLGALPTAIACARLHTKHVLLDWGLNSLIDDAELIVSELMTNAFDASVVLPHVPPIALRLFSDKERLIIEVWDQSPDDLVTRQADADAEGGRGLTVIAALSHAWGVERLAYRRKVVWCELRGSPGFLA
jgi:anti-sigma regulatory factor (Ser/Thr protein kinase)